MNTKKIEDKLKNKTVISHSGHRNLISEEKPEIRKKIEQQLKDITKGNSKGYIILTGVAEGADTTIIAVSLQLNIEVFALCIIKEDFIKFDQLKRDYPGSVFTAFDFARLVDNPDKGSAYLKLSQYLVQHADILLALWDGIYNNKKGGTSYTVNCFLNGGSFLHKRRKVASLYQLVVSRQDSRFPAGRYFNEFEINLPRADKFIWLETTLHRSALLRKLPIVEKINKLFKKRFRNAGEIFARFIIPLLLAVLVFVFGIVGYYTWADVADDKKTFANALFYTANLITLNASDFSKNNASNAYLEFARVFGGVLTAYAFALAFYFALGYENFHRLKFFFFRLGRGAYFNVVGLNEIAFDIAVHLRKKSKVIILHNDPDSHYVQRCKENNIWLIRGNPFSAAALRKTYFETAGQTYVVTGNEEDNFRCIQEMDQLIANKEVEKNTAEWFVHLTGSMQRNMLQDFIRNSNRSVLTCFSIPENTARRLLTRFPVNRYSSRNQNKVCIIIIGFTVMAEHIALTALQQAVLFEQNELEIHVYYDEAENMQVGNFCKTYSWLIKSGVCTAAPEDTSLWTVNPGKNLIEFHNRCSGGDEFSATAISMEEFLMPTNIVSIYVCSPSVIKNASFLSVFLPKLNYHLSKEVHCDTAVFWFCNLPDREEELYLQAKINALAPNLLVECFGNYLHETALTAIANKTMDHLARQVALWYYLLFDFKSDTVRNVREADIILDDLINKYVMTGAYTTQERSKEQEDNTWRSSWIIVQKSLWFKAAEIPAVATRIAEAMNSCWKSLSETDREGNRQAADHIWIKLNEARIQWELYDKPMLFDELKNFWEPAILKQLAILEHRRWNMMKLLEGWRPFTGQSDEWKKNKELLKKQKLHNLLVPYQNLPESEKVKDYHQIEGIPFFLNLFSRQKLQKWIKLGLKM